MSKSVVSQLEKAEWLEFHPVVWTPTTGDERLAALVAYMTGDGAMHRCKVRYAKRDGSISEYDKLSGAFYSNNRADVESIESDLQMLGLAASKIGIKKTLGDRADGFQIQVSKLVCETLFESGAPIGKKTTINFDVPDWVKSGDFGIKRAYLAALFGAEGSTPCKDRSSKSRLPRSVALSMCKIAPASAVAYFDSLVNMLLSFGVSASYSSVKKERFGKPYVTYTLTITGADDILRFFENVGYLYCAPKSLLAWQWSKYMRAYKHESQRRESLVTTMAADGIPFAEIGAAIGVTSGAAHRLLTDIRDGKSVRAGHGFPHFDEWLAKRWDAERGLLRLNVSSSSNREHKESVFNVLVSSPDHSYLLSNGANNFNSFETMSGRVYHPFDRRLHVRACKFDPDKPIWIGQDFNIDPMSTVILQPQDDGSVWVVDEIVLRGSNTEEVCDELERRYYRYVSNCYLFPDPAGQYRQHARGESDLDIFRERGFKKQRYHRKHPPIADRVNAVNRMLKSADGKIRLYIDPKCRHLIASLEQTIYKRHSREIDKDADVEHSGDALGYCIHYQFPIRKVEIAGVSI